MHDPEALHIAERLEAIGNGELVEIADGLTVNKRLGDMAVISETDPDLLDRSAKRIRDDLPAGCGTHTDEELERLTRAGMAAAICPDRVALAAILDPGRETLLEGIGHHHGTSAGLDDARMAALKSFRNGTASQSQSSSPRPPMAGQSWS